MCSHICLCACWTTLDVPARCSFWYRTCKRSRHFVRVRSRTFCCGVFSYSSPRPLVTLCALDGSCCGTVLSLIWLSQPSQHFVRVGSLSLWCGANMVSCFSQRPYELWFLWKILLLGSCESFIVGPSYADLDEGIVEVSVRGSSTCMILYTSLLEDLVDVLAHPSEVLCMMSLRDLAWWSWRYPVVAGVCTKALLGCS